MISPIITGRCKRYISFFAVLVCAFLGASLVSNEVFAAQIPNSAFSTSNLIVKTGANATVVPENGVIDCGSSIGLDFDWEINSETTLTAGDVLRANPKGMSSENHIPLTVRETAPVNILGENDEVIATWSGKPNGIIEIVVAEAGAGTHTLSGHIYTGMNLLISACRNYDVNDTIMADTTSGAGTQDVRHVTISKAVYYAAPRHYGIINLTSAKTTMSAFTPTQAINSIYASNGQELISSGDTIKDLWIESSSSEDFNNYTVEISARVAVPAGTEGDVANMNGGVSMNGLNVPLPECEENGQRPCKQRVDANEGETKEAFVQRLKQTQGNQAIILYGLFENSMIAYFGDIPNANSEMTYKKAIQNFDSDCTTFYCVTPEFQPAGVSEAIDEAVSEDNVYGGTILYYNFVSSFYFTNPLSVDGQQVTSTGTWHYRNGDDRVIEDSKLATKTVSIGSGSAVIERGTASLQLIDKDTKAPIKGASFKLQVLENQTWQDVENSSRTTNNEGKLEIDSLNDGNYRWVQTSYVEHYRDDWAKYYDGTNLEHEINSFVLGSTGYNAVAVNERQSFTVTFAGGDHASSNFVDIVRTQKYNDTTIIPSSENITGINGWYFDGWDKEVAMRVTENVTYTATWKAEQTSIRGNIVWIDADNDDGIRPDRVYVNATLGSTTIDRSALVNADGEFEIEGLTKCDNQGNPYDYSVTARVDGYDATVTNNDDGTITVYLTHMPEVDITVNINWDDCNNKYRLRPDNIELYVLRNDHPSAYLVVSNNEGRAVFEDLPKYSVLDIDSVLSVFTISEGEIEYYTTSVVQNSDYEFTITNTINDESRVDCGVAIVQLPVKGRIKKDSIEATIIARENAPMSAVAENGRIAKSVDISGGISFEDVEFPEAGEYLYDIQLSSDSYTINKESFTVKLVVKRDIASGELCLTDVYVVDGGNETPIEDSDIEIRSNEPKDSENPDTAATNSIVLFVVFGMVIAGLGIIPFVMRQR